MTDSLRFHIPEFVISLKKAPLSGIVYHIGRFLGAPSPLLASYADVLRLGGMHDGPNNVCVGGYPLQD